MYQYVYIQQQQQQRAVNTSGDLAEFQGRGLFLFLISRLHLNKQTNSQNKIYTNYLLRKIRNYIQI